MKHGDVSDDPFVRTAQIICHKVHNYSTLAMIDFAAIQSPTDRMSLSA